MGCLEMARSGYGGRTYPESFPNSVLARMGAKDFWVPILGEVIMDAACVNDVASSAIRVCDVGCWKGVVVPGASGSPPPIVSLPIPFVEMSGCVFSFANGLSQD